MKVYFETSSVLASYNLDLPKALSSSIHTFVDIDNPLLYVIYLYEKIFHGRYNFYKTIPPYLGRLMRTEFLRKVDVVHLNSLNTELAKKAKELGKPVVSVLHAAPFPKEVYDEIDEINDYVDVYVAPSNFTKQNEETKVGSKNIVVIHHGIDTELFNPTTPREEARRKLRVPLNVKVILWNDRIAPEKDLESFIEAMEYVLEEVKDVYVYIKGRAVVKNYYDKVKEPLRKLQKSYRVKLHIGWIPHSMLPLLYRAADIFIRTSKHENFGLGAIEAMACGTPVVAPNATTFPEVIGDVTTLYRPGDPVDLAKKVITLLTDRNLYNSITEYQLTRARRYFNILHVAQKYIELYSSLIK